MKELIKKVDSATKTLIEIYNELPDYIESRSMLDPMFVRSRSTIGDIVFVLCDIKDRLSRTLISSDDDTERVKE